MTTNALPRGARKQRGRTDIHRPEVFRPEDYDFSHCGTRHPDADPQIRRFAAQQLRALIDAGHRWAEHHDAGKCDHCGTAILYYAVLIHRPTGELIEVGETCLDGRFEMANDEFQAWRKSVAGNRAKQAKAARVVALIEKHPMLAQLGKWGEENDFIHSLATQLMDRGELSEKQIDAAEKAIQREIDRAEQKAAEAEAMANVPPMTEGRRLISGTIISKKWKESGFGYGSSGSWKIVLRDAEGYRYYGTLPSAVCELDRGAHLQLVATVKPSNDDKHFGFFSRPTLKG